MSSLKNQFLAVKFISRINEYKYEMKNHYNTGYAGIGISFLFQWE